MAYSWSKGTRKRQQTKKSQGVASAGCIFWLSKKVRRGRCVVRWLKWPLFCTDFEGIIRYSPQSLLQTI